ncbi:MAG: hypothetical protein JXA54_07065 [Candidatus Heimdallarchaeota archaeon]|nr:hypothetical protein [Candidatus Heimdallarchaeota archaeon]
MTTDTNRILKFDKNQLSLFTQDIKEKLKNKDWSAISFTSAIFIFLTSFAILVRLLFAFYYRETFSTDTNPIIWNRNVNFYPNGAYFAGYVDFSYYYKAWVDGWFTQGWYPFTDWHEAAEGDDPLDFYSYPPIFLYFLVSLWRPGLNDLWLALPMIIADAACAGMVYLIIKKMFKDEKYTFLAFIGGFLMTLSPINIIYDGVYWLNPGPVTLFTIISFYFLLKRKWRQTFFWLALATMTKQNALFFSYPLFFIMLGEKVHEKGVKRGAFESMMNAIYFVLVCLIISIPWIFITPLFYGVHMLYPGQMLRLDSYIKNPEPNHTVQFSWALNEIGVNESFTNFIAFALNSMLLMIVSSSIIAIPLLWRAFNNKLDDCEIFEVLAIYTIITHIFMPRGVYKFYSAYYMPIIIVALIGSLGFYGKHWITKLAFLTIGISLFFAFSFWHLLIPRELTPLILFLASIVIAFFAGIRGTFKQLNKHYQLNLK